MRSCHGGLAKENVQTTISTDVMILANICCLIIPLALSCSIALHVTKNWPQALGLRLSRVSWNLAQFLVIMYN